MIQCEQCEYFSRGEDGQVAFACDPFSTIKEPECLTKWQLIKINQMVAGHEATLRYYERLAPMQEKMFKLMESEMEELNEAEQWKYLDEDDDEDEEDDPAGYDPGRSWQ